jgi:hypothetical protein
VEQGPTLLDLVIALLQSIGVLLLASGAYVALAVRKGDGTPVTAEPGSAAAPRGQRIIATR